MRHVVWFSGGVCSWAAAKRVAAQHGTENLQLVFADTLIEDEDLYRFLPEAAANVGGELVRIAEGRTPWQVFEDEGFLGNTRVDLCSRILKRDLLDKWRNENCDPGSTICYVGLDALEFHRLERIQQRCQPWRYEAPICERPYMSKLEMLAWCRDEGLEPPRLYGMGFAHNNCGGGCVKSGQAQFERLLRTMPERYREWEENELRLGTGTILRDRRGGETKPLTLKAFRERLEGQPELFDAEEWGGCGCSY